jgi:FtsP/CotA-like multicopper oxidase with cupredoxin domain
LGKPIFALSRREMMAGLGACVFAPGPGAAAPLAPLAVVARPGGIVLRPDRAPTPVWELSAANQSDGLRFRRGERIEMSFQNGLPVPTVPLWYGLDGASGAEALTARRAILPGAKESFTISMPHAGTLMMDLRLLGDGQALPARPLPLILLENEPVAVDRDELILLEDWRLLADGRSLVPGSAAADAAPLFTVNGRIMPDITARPNERLRLRFINGCQRAVVALKIEGHDVTVIAIDGQPAEPFVARNGAVVLPPGGRCDAFVDATAPPGSASPILLHDGAAARAVGRLVTSDAPPMRPARLPTAAPLPPNGLPVRLDLKGALRVEMTLGSPQGEWVRPVSFSTSAAPAFRARPGRIVVLALTNRAGTATVFRLHGHHFRLLDRLDDGWKPFWLDTLAVEPGQTERIAFSADHAGRWLIESVAAEWAAPRLVRWYAVE